MIKAGMKGTFKRKGSPPMKQIYQQCHYAVIWEPWYWLFWGFHFNIWSTVCLLAMLTIKKVAYFGQLTKLDREGWHICWHIHYFACQWELDLSGSDKLVIYILYRLSSDSASQRSNEFTGASKLNVQLVKLI